MERQFFTWNDWDNAGPDSYYFYGCIASRDFEDFKLGEDLGTCLLELNDYPGKLSVRHGTSSEQKFNLEFITSKLLKEEIK